MCLKEPKGAKEIYVQVCTRTSPRGINFILAKRNKTSDESLNGSAWMPLVKKPMSLTLLERVPSLGATSSETDS